MSPERGVSVFGTPKGGVSTQGGGEHHHQRWIYAAWPISPSISHRMPKTCPTACSPLNLDRNMVIGGISVQRNTRGAERDGDSPNHHSPLECPRGQPQNPALGLGISTSGTRITVPNDRQVVTSRSLGFSRLPSDGVQHDRSRLRPADRMRGATISNTHRESKQSSPGD